MDNWSFATKVRCSYRTLSGFKYPTPNLTTSVTVLSPSRLDPYLWIRAMQDADVTHYVKEGQAKDMIATSTGERFSFRYVIPE